MRRFLLGCLSLLIHRKIRSPRSLLMISRTANGCTWAIAQSVTASKARAVSGPALNQPRLRRVNDNWSLYGVIKNGVQGTEMPGAWQMTEREAWRVAGYVRSIGRVAAVNLPGDAGRGKELYQSKGCAVCHIAQGQGGDLGPELTEIGARRSAAYLREALTDPAASAPEEFLVVRVTTRDGRSVRGVRINEDSFTIQLRDDDNRFHSFRKNELKDLKKEVGVSTMPSYKTLAAAELDDLVAYLASLRGEK